MRKIMTGWLLWAAGLLAAGSQAFGISPVLKFRILLDPVPESQSADSIGMDITILNDPAAGTSSQKSREAAGALEQIRTSLSRSDYIRFVEHGGDPSLTDLVLRYRVDREGAEPVLYLSLLDPRSHAVVHAFSAQADSVANAVAAVMERLEKALLERDWTARVKNSVKGKLVIDRGERDGLRTGLVLNGYSVAKDAGSSSMDELLLLAGQPAGTYTVVQIRDEAALLEPVGEAPALEPGDVLEYRGVDFRKTDEPNRDRDTWNRLYKKD